MSHWIGQKHIYYRPEQGFASSMWIGSKFQDSGLTMEVTRIGEAYNWGNNRIVDFEATVVAEPPGRERKSTQDAIDSFRGLPSSAGSGSGATRDVLGQQSDVDVLKIKALAQQQGRRTYTVSQKSFLHVTGSYGLWIGTEFKDSGLTMVVAKIGQAYRWGNEKFVDVEALVKKSDNSATAADGKRS
jgi:hypothetical protein